MATVDTTTTPALKFFSAQSEVASNPTATCQLDDGFKLLCGGAQVASGTGWGNTLTASYPPSIFAWTAASKDQDHSDQRQITAWACGVYDPQDLYDIQIFSTVSGVDPEAHPAATANVPSGYELVGGGAQAHYSDEGQFLTGSYPSGDLSGWNATSIDHIESDFGSVTAFAVGLRARGTTPPPSVILSNPSRNGPASAPSADAPPPPGTTLIGGGAFVPSDVPWGNMLTSSFFDDAEGILQWTASSHDQQQTDEQTITVWSLGIEWNTT